MKLVSGHPWGQWPRTGSAREEDMAIATCLLQALTTRLAFRMPQYNILMAHLSISQSSLPLMITVRSLAQKNVTTWRKEFSSNQEIQIAALRWPPSVSGTVSLQKCWPHKFFFHRTNMSNGFWIECERRRWTKLLWCYRWNININVKWSSSGFFSQN